MDASSYLTVGTAGHIDHGKTALVRALTGAETDRLAEERRRGISIELGFAELELGERRLSLIDVPGHERLVRTMIAGAAGIDLFLLAVAADDGAMPQTREHLAVLDALGVGRGVVALTKAGLVDEETLLIAAAECEDLVPGAPVVAVDSLSGDGIAELREAIDAVAAGIDPGPAGRPEEEPLLHVDRCFTVAGHGTVVTGTLWSGTLERGQRLLAIPGEREARVRALEVHGRPVERAGPRRRVAVNLGGLRREEVARGDALTVAGSSLRATYRLDVELTAGCPEISRERRAQVHLGTREAPARVVPLGEGRAQLRLERPLLARRGDRFVVRRIAPPDTLGGGLVESPDPPRHGPSRAQSPSEGPAMASASAVVPAMREEARSQTDDRGQSGGGGPSGLARTLLRELEGDGLRPRSLGTLADSLEVPRRELETALRELVTAGEAVRVARDVAYPAPAYARLRDAIAELTRRRGSTSIAELRDALGVSRKYAQALLESLDAERVLRREGDRHYPRETVQRA